MYRIAIEKLYRWKASKRRKPLIIEGARQVGKTWLMKEFGKQAYESTVYINFDSNSRMADLFASDLDTDRLIIGLELLLVIKSILTTPCLFLTKFKRYREHFLLLHIFIKMHLNIILFVPVLFWKLLYIRVLRSLPVRSIS